MKGQVFIIISVIVVIAIAGVISANRSLLATGDGVSDVSEFSSLFSNIRSELKYSADLGIADGHKTDLVEDAVSEMLGFVQGTEDIDIVYVISNFNDEEGILNITVGNRLNELMSSVLIEENLTGSSNAVASIEHGSSHTESITANPGSETGFQVDVSYTSGNTTYNETFLSAAGPFNSTTVYYRARLNVGDSFLEDAFQTDVET